MRHSESTSSREWCVPFWSIALTVVLILWVTGNTIAYIHHGNIGLVYGVLSLFLSINLLISYSEICIFVKRDYVEERSKYWIERGREGSRSPAIEFLSTSVPVSRVLSPKVFAETFAAYAYYDRSYADRRTYGFLADVSNGIVSPIPSVLLFATYTFPFLPAFAAGIIGLMLYWMWVFTSSVYWGSFFIGGGHHQISKVEMYIYVWSTNAVWIVFPLIGLFASLSMVVESNYSVLGL